MNRFRNFVLLALSVVGSAAVADAVETKEIHRGAFNYLYCYVQSTYSTINRSEFGTDDVVVERVEGKATIGYEIYAGKDKMKFVASCAHVRIWH